mmetsp:Transcript_1706/g.5487  ORF Transcript_1706/g.5487 Transcript_1706/m.5487 type:complete len:231 (-) Transcript_1706:31-723(-)
MRLAAERAVNLLLCTRSTMCRLNFRATRPDRVSERTAATAGPLRLPSDPNSWPRRIPIGVICSFSECMAVISVNSLHSELGTRKLDFFELLARPESPTRVLHTDMALQVLSSNSEPLTKMPLGYIGPTGELASPSSSLGESQTFSGEKAPTFGLRTPSSKDNSSKSSLALGVSTPPSRCSVRALVLLQVDFGDGVPSKASAGTNSSSAGLAAGAAQHHIQGPEGRSSEAI